MINNNEGGFCSGEHGMKSVVAIMVVIVLAILAAYLVLQARNAARNYDYIGKSPDYKNIISVEGTGKVTAKPDVAMVSLGIVTDGGSVSQIQKQNTDKMNSIIKSLKDQFKIADEDIQTSNYNINPKYDWSGGSQRIVGYTISQSVSVKVRDFEQIGNVLAKSSELGANSVNGPQFTIDDPEVYKAQAREEAIAKAKEKARVLADQVGISLGRIVSFSEGTAGYPIAYDSAYGMGGSEISLKSAVAPDIQAGSQEVQVNVSINYEIR